MNHQELLSKLDKANNDGLLLNQIAQANSRYILLNTQESNNSLPNYTIRDERLELLALYFINLGACLAELNDFDNAIGALEKGASIIEYIHGTEANQRSSRNYYGLIAALAYYVSYQYSKSFILTQKISSESIIAKLISLFLQRKFPDLLAQIESIIVDATYSDEFLSRNIGEVDGEKSVYEITIAKSLNDFIEYFFSGNVQALNDAKNKLRTLKEIAELNDDPGIWWVIRLLLLISEGFTESSLWNCLSPLPSMESDLGKKYIRSLIYSGIYELFLTQRKSLPQVLNNENTGCVISIPTSSGKTRIAELAIVDCINDDQHNKVLYIAPFRSLAFEIENSFDRILGAIDINVSQLYGGSLFNKLDKKIIDEAQVIIATPEKAKAMLRTNEDILKHIKLVIIDEGHLLGDDDRLIVNEIFYEELRCFVTRNKGRFLLLSAVLPNSDELALWLNGNKETVFKHKWKPSDERLGILEWTGDSVNLDWKNEDKERPTFNRRFIVKEQLPPRPRQRKPKYFPSDKNDAVAATAYKLRTFGSILIFVGLKDSVIVMANSYLKCLGEAPEDFQWTNKNDWNAFELATIETYGENNVWLLYAKKGILCHNASLHNDVRLPLERLMRNDKPHAIIATSTLGQGVNIGVSCVIFSTMYQAGVLISPRDFWNIAGRAGRAFVDREGKILVALDTSDKSKRGLWVTRQNRKEIEKYFDKERIDIAKSGILALLNELYLAAKEAKLDFARLIEIVSNNNLQKESEAFANLDKKFDLVDDSLLTLAHLNTPESTTDLTWVEMEFKKTLALIQHHRSPIMEEAEILSLIKARIQGIITHIGEDRKRWNSIISSGIPLKSDLFIQMEFFNIFSTCSDYLLTSKGLDDKLRLLAQLEAMLKGIPCLEDDLDEIASNDADKIRELWLSGKPISEIQKLENASNIITKYFTYKLPWILNGIAKKFKLADFNDEADCMEELALLVEVGLPGMVEVKVYQTGIRSRVAACELGRLFTQEIWDKSIIDYKEDLINDYEFYKNVVSAESAAWIDLMVSASSKRKQKIKKIPNFTFEDLKPEFTLVPKMINNQQYLVSTNLEFQMPIDKSDIDFLEVNNVPGVYFDYNEFGEYWEMRVENPFVDIDSEGSN